MRRIYVPLVSVAGLIVVAHCVSALIQDPINPEWLVLAALTLLTGSFTVKLPALPVRLSVSETFVFSSVILFGTCAGTLTVALEILISFMAGAGRRVRQPVRVLFNVSSAALSIWCAGHVFYLTAGIGPVSGQQIELQNLLLPLIALAATYFFLNSGMVAAAVATQTAGSTFYVWRTNFPALSLNYIGGASLAGLLVSYTHTVDLITLGIIVPLLVISYLTFKTSLGRVEDAMRHVEQVKKLYLSTIETLAMAIDVKDQVTHGHIRRVQRFALGLAEAIGVNDDAQLRALEAAALLHDTGKLVVPEHILNKPGRLTPGEFEKMKRHASAGADILSSIEFPYPVVPIVRHHHENWDGTGYPDGLKGTDIPLGARILQVVDCFDALTSDRPYRRRLSDEEAIAIVMQRRGTMYDPLIVDTFAAVKDRLTESAPLRDTAPVFAARIEAAPQSHSAESSIIQASPFVSTARAVLQTMLEATGARLAICFVRNASTDELNTLAAISRDGVTKHDVSMPVGSRVSGWVAANGRAVVNADAALDFPDVEKGLNLAKCLSVPLNRGAQPLGVVTVYLDDARGFSDHDLLAVEAALGVIDLAPLAKLYEALGELKPHERRPTVH
jgi:putative nucleotidyltransferase with HDIG domain